MVVRIVHQRRREFAGGVGEANKSINGVIREMGLYLAFVFSQKVVTQDEEVPTVYYFEAVGVGPAFYREDDGDCNQHEQTFSRRANHWTDAGSAWHVSDDGVWWESV